MSRKRKHAVETLRRSFQLQVVATNGMIGVAGRGGGMHTRTTLGAKFLLDRCNGPTGWTGGRGGIAVAGLSNGDAVQQIILAMVVFD